eukprot:5416130-Alexandrium_andersonii.AAC.1
MSASLVGSEMCIRDSPEGGRRAPRSLTTAPVGQCSTRREPSPGAGAAALPDLAARLVGTACHWAPSES